MANLGDDTTPVKGENFSLPAGAQIDEDGGELVVRDTSGEIILRRDETAGNWNFEGGELRNIGSVNTERATINDFLSEDHRSYERLIDEDSVSDFSVDFNISIDNDTDYYILEIDIFRDEAKLENGVQLTWDFMSDGDYDIRIEDETGTKSTFDGRNEYPLLTPTLGANHGMWGEWKINTAEQRLAIDGVAGGGIRRKEVDRLDYGRSKAFDTGTVTGTLQSETLGDDYRIKAGIWTLQPRSDI